MVGIDIVYEGDLHTEARHEPSGARLVTDAPVDNQGRGAAFSPTDLLATALGACMTTIMGIAAREHGWSIEGTRVRVEKHMVQAPERRVGRLRVCCTFPAGLAADALQVLESAARCCPVCRSLSPEIELDLEFRAGPG